MRERITFLDQGETLGGSERFLIDFFNTLLPHEIKKINPLILGAENPDYKELLPNTVETQSFPFPSLKGGFFRKINSVRKLIFMAHRLKKIAQRENASIVFANTPRTIFTAFLAKKIFRMESRLVIMIHDFTIPPSLLRKIGRVCRTIIVNAIPTRTFVKKTLTPKDQLKIKIVENGIDTEKIKSISTARKIEKILMLGRIDPRKGQIFALQSAKILKSAYPEISFSIVGSSFSGDRETIAYEKKIRKMAREENISNVYFFSEVKNPQEIINQHDCVLALSTEPETFGRVVIEALAMGKLVIAFAQTGPKEILEEFARFSHFPAEKLLAEPNNEIALTEKIESFLLHPEEIGKITQKGSAFIQQKYSLSETKKRLLLVLFEH